MKHIHTFNSFLNEAASVPSNIMDFAKRKGPAATSMVKKAATWAEKAGKKISGGTAIGKNYSTIILDMKYQGAEIYINLDDETIELFGEEVTDAKSFKKVLDAEVNESEVNEWRKPKVEDLIHDMKVKITRGRYAGSTGNIHDFQLTDGGDLVDDQIDIKVDKPGKPMNYIGLDDILIESINEKIDMSNAKVGQTLPYGEQVRNRTYGLLQNGMMELGTLKFREAQSVAKELKAAGFDAEALQVRGDYHDGYVHVKAPRAHDDIQRLAGVIEDTLGNILISADEKRVRETGKL